MTQFIPSYQGDQQLALSQAGLRYGRTNAGIYALNEIYKAKKIMKFILAGADCLREISTLQKNGIFYNAIMICEMEQWM